MVRLNPMLGNNMSDILDLPPKQHLYDAKLILHSCNWGKHVQSTQVLLKTARKNNDVIDVNENTRMFIDHTRLVIWVYFHLVVSRRHVYCWLPARESRVSSMRGRALASEPFRSLSWR